MKMAIMQAAVTRRLRKVMSAGMGGGLECSTANVWIPTGSIRQSLQECRITIQSSDRWGNRGCHHPFEPPTGLQGLAGCSCRAVVLTACCLEALFGVASAGVSPRSGADSVVNVADVAAVDGAAVDVDAGRDGGSGRATEAVTGVARY
jgi:hypothetical protein